jgi:hypothetical protein
MEASPQHSEYRFTSFFGPPSPKQHDPDCGDAEDDASHNLRNAMLLNIFASSTQGAHMTMTSVIRSGRVRALS